MGLARELDGFLDIEVAWADICRTGCKLLNLSFAACICEYFPLAAKLKLLCIHQ